MLVNGFGDIFKKHLVPELETILLTKTLKRSMTDMVKVTEFMRVDDGNTLEQAAAQLNKTPFKAIDYNHPRDQFTELAR